MALKHRIVYEATSLEAVIQELKPVLKAAVEAQRAYMQAKSDIFGARGLAACGESLRRTPVKSSFQSRLSMRQVPAPILIRVAERDAVNLLKARHDRAQRLISPSVTPEEVECPRHSIVRHE
jgi:hypothetical protein